jgi:hypothetical protein
MPHRILENAGLFIFAGSREVARGAFDAIAGQRLSETDRDRYFDLLMLTAGEAALAAPSQRALFLRTSVPPVDVDVASVHYAIQKWNSTPTWPHIAESPTTVRLWDVMLFAGDMSKVAQLAGESVATIAENGGFAGLVDRLKSAYREAGNPLALEVSNSRVLDLLGVIWHAKASVILNPEGADDSVTAYLDRLTWYGPIGRS